MEDFGSTVELTMTNSEKDLGIWITSSLKPSLQCDKAAATASRILGMLKRTFTKLSRELFVFLYRTYVRPHLEYCIQLWSPYLSRDIDKLENVPRRATKLVTELANLPYESRLRELGLYSLYSRQQRGDLIEVYKVLHGYYDIDWSRYFTLNSVHSTRGHCMKLFKKQSHLLLRSNFFTQRVISFYLMKLFNHPLPPLSKQALIVTGLTSDMDMNKGPEPELYFAIWNVYIHLTIIKIIKYYQAHVNSNLVQLKATCYWCDFLLIRNVIATKNTKTGVGTRANVKTQFGGWGFPGVGACSWQVSLFIMIMVVYSCRTNNIIAGQYSGVQPENNF